MLIRSLAVGSAPNSASGQGVKASSLESVKSANEFPNFAMTYGTYIPTATSVPSPTRAWEGCGLTGSARGEVSGELSGPVLASDWLPV